MREKTETLKNGNHQAGVILLHGLTGMPSELRPVAKHLTKLGYLVETPLLPGHGAGHPELLASNWKEWVNFAKHAFDEMSQRCEQVFIGGLSMGALLATIAAAEDSRVKGLIVLSPTLYYDGHNTSPYGAFLWLVDYLPELGKLCYWTEEPPFGLQDVRLQRQIIKSMEAAASGESDQFGLFRTYAGSLRQLELLVQHLRKNARKVRCPAMFVHSLEDTLATIKNTTELVSMISSQDKTLHLLSGCDHVLTLDLRKKDVANFVGEFVTRLAPLPVQPENSAVPASTN